MSIHHSPDLCGWEKLMVNQGTLESVWLYKIIRSSVPCECWCVRLHVCVHTHWFVLTSLNCTHSPGVFTVLRVRWINQLPDWIDWKKNRLQITLTCPSFSTQSVASECKFPPQSVRWYLLCVRSVDSSKALLFSLHNHAAAWLLGWEMRPAGSSGVKTSRWFSDVSEGQISFLLLRFIRQLIKEDRSMEGDSTFTSEWGKGK